MDQGYTWIKMNRRIVEWMDGQADGWLDGWTDGWMDG